MQPPVGIQLELFELQGLDYKWKCWAIGLNMELLDSDGIVGAPMAGVQMELFGFEWNCWNSNGWNSNGTVRIQMEFQQLK